MQPTRFREAILWSAAGWVSGMGRAPPTRSSHTGLAWASVFSRVAHICQLRADMGHPGWLVHLLRALGERRTRFARCPHLPNAGRYGAPGLARPSASRRGERRTRFARCPHLPKDGRYGAPVWLVHLLRALGERRTRFARCPHLPTAGRYGAPGLFRTSANCGRYEATDRKLGLAHRKRASSLEDARCFCALGACAWTASPSTCLPCRRRVRRLLARLAWARGFPRPWLPWSA
jgi:hypothetical protein